VAPRAARVFLFLLPGGRPRRQDDEGTSIAAGATFLPLPFRRLGPRFLGAPSPPRTGVAPTTVAAAAAARAAKVFWLQFPFGRPHLWDAGGIIAGIAASLPLLFERPGPRFSGTPSPPSVETSRTRHGWAELWREDRGRGRSGLSHRPQTPPVFKEQWCGRKGSGIDGA
jgi:hypothetical protein